MSYNGRYKGAYGSAYSGIFGGGSVCPWVVTLNGVDQRVDFPNTVLTVPAGIEMQIISYINTTSTDEGIVSAFTNDVDNYIYMSVTASGFIKLNTNSYTPAMGVTPVNDGAWHKVITVINTTTGAYTVYVDDQVDYTGTHTNPASLQGSFSFIVGAVQTVDSGTPTDYYTGKIADFGIVADGSPVFFSSINDGWANNPVITNSLSITRPLAYLNGVDQSITVPTLALVSGDTVSLKFKGSTGVGNHVLISPSSGPAPWTMNGSVWTNYFGNVTATLDGVPLTDGDPVPADNLEHTLVMTYTAASDISVIGDYFSGSWGSNFPIFDVEITAVAGNRFYAIDDEANTIVDSVNGQDGTANNFVAGTWASTNLADGLALNFTESTWARDCSKPASPVFNVAYTTEYATEYAQ